MREFVANFKKKVPYSTENVKIFHISEYFNILSRIAIREF